MILRYKNFLHFSYITALLFIGAACSKGEEKADVKQSGDVSENSSYTFNADFSGNSMIGVSHIAADPNLDHQTLDDGVAMLMSLNVKNAFFYLTTNFREKYIQQDFGPSNPQSLTEVANLAPYRRAFAKFDTVVLTCTSDGFSTVGLSIRDHYLSDAQYDANRKEFFDLTTSLMNTYNGTKKRFILKNWEGDWLLHNGYDPNADVPDERIRNFVRWFKSSQEGIEQARNASKDSSDVKVEFALEMNQIGIVQDGKKNTFLGDIVPQVPSDWVAYSAWESTSNRGGSQDPDKIYKSIVADLADLKLKAKRPIFVTEFGYAESGQPDVQAARTRAAVRAFRDSGIELAFYWNTYEKTYGLYRLDGKRTPNGAFYALREEIMKEQINEGKYFSSKEATNVTAAYWGVFGRKPANGEFDYWFNNSAAKDASLIHKYFAESDEARRVITQTYLKYTGEEPDQGSQDYLLGALSAGNTIYDIGSWIFLGQKDYKTPPAVAIQPVEPPLDGDPPVVALPMDPPVVDLPEEQPKNPSCVGDRLSQGQELIVGQELCSADGRFVLPMQQDGNLVLYQGVGQAIWSSNTGGSGATKMIFQNDGNLVIYKGSDAVWSSETGGSFAQSLVLQKDGNLVLRKDNNAIWDTKTGGR